MPAAERATFIDIYRFLADDNRRARILEFVTDAELKNDGKKTFRIPRNVFPLLLA